MARWIMGVVAGLLVASGAQAADPKLETVALEKMYVPIGFDSNDLVQVVVTGTFATTALQIGKTKFEVVPPREPEGPGEIRLTQYAYRYADGTEWPIKNSFHKLVDLVEGESFLPSGVYEVIDTVSNKSLGVLPVKAATYSGTGRDDYPYAPVSDVWIRPSKDLKKQEIHLQGIFPNSCMEMKSVEVHAYPEVIVVQPVVKMNEPEPGKVCEFGNFPYRVKKSLDSVLPSNTYLLHVRTMAGGSINRFITPYASGEVPNPTLITNEF